MRNWGTVGRGFLLHATYSEHSETVLCGANLRKSHRFRLATPEQLAIRAKCMKCWNISARATPNPNQAGGEK